MMCCLPWRCVASGFCMRVGAFPVFMLEPRKFKLSARAWALLYHLDFVEWLVISFVGSECLQFFYSHAFDDGVVSIFCTSIPMHTSVSVSMLNMVL